jgi:hypothetical protein
VGKKFAIKVEASNVEGITFYVVWNKCILCKRTKGHMCMVLVWIKR